MTLTVTNPNDSLILLKDNIVLNCPLAIGTLQWGTTWVDDKLINSKGCLREATTQEIVTIFDKAGVTLYDTAEGYGGGTSEKRCGRLLSPPSSNTTGSQDDKHRDIVFMTKFLPAPWRCFQSDLENAVRASCRRLQVKCIPIYLLHSPVHWRPIEFWVQACALCHQKGLIQAMGLSNCNSEQVERAVAAGKKYGVPVICNQVHYSILDYNSPALQTMEATCKRLHVQIIAFSPIGQGLLTDNLTPEKWKTIKPVHMLHLQWDDVQPVRAAIRELAKKYEKTMAQIALNWCIQHQVIPLVGCRSPDQARDSVGCLGWKLNQEDVTKLDKLALSKSTLESKHFLFLWFDGVLLLLSSHICSAFVSVKPFLSASLGPAWRRMLFVSLFGIVMVVCRTLDNMGFVVAK